MHGRSSWKPSKGRKGKSRDLMGMHFPESLGEVGWALAHKPSPQVLRGVQGGAWASVPLLSAFSCFPSVKFTPCSSRLHHLSLCWLQGS